MRPKHTTLTPQELEIMKLVWQRQSATVRDIFSLHPSRMTRHQSKGR
jgi:predicted transcriptional regulator